MGNPVGVDIPWNSGGTGSGVNSTYTIIPFSLNKYLTNNLKSVMLINLEYTIRYLACVPNLAHGSHQVKKWPILYKSNNAGIL